MLCGYLKRLVDIPELECIFAVDLTTLFMKKAAIVFLSILSVLFMTPATSYAQSENDYGDDSTQIVDETSAGMHNLADSKHDDHGHEPAMWAVIPFVLLLLMIATGPLFFEHFWHKNYPAVAIGLGLMVVAYYTFSLHDVDSVIHSLAEYFQFIALLAGLFMSAGGILIKVDKEGKPGVNVILLIIGAVLANLIGTTGASMLLIRPFIKLNKDRIKAYHVIFFIFMVSNVGGALTPIGDPPLFLGFLKGVPFAWTITHDFVPWVFAITLLSILFIIVDSRNKSDHTSTVEYTGKISIKGTQNFLWIAIIIAAVFIDPNVWNTVSNGEITKMVVPCIAVKLHGELVQISFIREVLMLTVGFLSFKTANREALKGNEFDFEPIKEVAFIFIGIFFTMMPALALVADFAKSDEGAALINTHSLYWLTGALSGVLDNAPTYLNFFAAAFSADGGSTMNPESVKAYTEASGVFAGKNTIVHLTAISCASVFFGAMTYIGNAPNFMVKAIAEQSGVKMPAFMTYVVKYSIPILLPILFLVWLVFFFADAINWFI